MSETRRRGERNQQRSSEAKRRAFDDLARDRTNEIKVHCYRIMGSLSEAEDLTQETFARAWRSWDGLSKPASARSWLYRIATNLCLDALRRRNRQRRLFGTALPMETGSFAELGAPDTDVDWLEPLPDSLLGDLSDESLGPHAIYEQAEAVRLAFLACVQILPARQRAIFLLCEVLGWSAADVAAAFAMTPQAVNSLLQRARRAFETAYRREPKWAVASPTDQKVAERYAMALEAHDIDAFVALLRLDATVHMPPWRAWLRGSAAIARFSEDAWTRYSGFRAHVFRANGRCAVVVYGRAAGDDAWRPHSLHVIEVVEGAIASIVAFVGPLAPSVFSSAGLPSSLADGGTRH
jgi:RNA polymerase sigma-70 factor (ECF subfamily)